MHINTARWALHEAGNVHNSDSVGDPCVIAEVTGVSCIADFRVRDMAVGGGGSAVGTLLEDVRAFAHSGRSFDPLHGSNIFR